MFLIVTRPEFLLEILVVALDAPALVHARTRSSSVQVGVSVERAYFSDAG